jgi:hypothetical protein
VGRGNCEWNGLGAEGRSIGVLRLYYSRAPMTSLRVGNQFQLLEFNQRCCRNSFVLGLAIVSQVGATCYKRHSTTNPTTSPKTSSTTSPETCHVIVTETAWTTVPTCASTTTETESTTTTSTSTVTVSAYPTHVIRNPSFEDSRDRSWSRQNANLYEVETPDAPAHSGYNRA